MIDPPFFLAKKSHNKAIDFFLHVSIPQFFGFNLVARFVVFFDGQKCCLVT